MGSGRALPAAESELLIHCADIRQHGTRSERIREILSKDLDWSRIMRKAVNHGLGPLLYSTVHSANATGLLPEAPLKYLRSCYYANAARSLMLEQGLLSVLKVFMERDIPCLVLKGLFLIRLLYDNPALRPTSDIDLLVRVEDLPGIDEALNRLGYELATDGLPAGFYRRIHFHMLYRRKSVRIPIPVEVHWNVQDQFNVLRIDTEEIWNAARPWHLGGARALTMRPEHLLAYLCYHAEKHGRHSGRVGDGSGSDKNIILEGHGAAKLLWYGEILKLIERYESELDWDRFGDTCWRWGIEREAHTTLALVRMTFGAASAVKSLARLSSLVAEKRAAAAGSGSSSRFRLGTSRLDVVAHRLLPSLWTGNALLGFRPARFLDIWS
jgi:hypothetical protein